MSREELLRASQGRAQRHVKWAQLSVDARCVSADAVADVFIEEGCAGAAHVQSGDDSVIVSAYLPVDDRLEARIESIRSRVSALAEFSLPVNSTRTTVRLVFEKDWANAWKSFFKPLRVGRIVIKPSWEDFTPDAETIVVELDPGMAFGTGSHPTTQLCLMALQRLVEGGETILDVGTGSGILSIAAAKLGASRVVALDIDPVAVEAARRNIASEGLSGIVSCEEADSPGAFEGTADIVVANIIAQTIIALADDLDSRLKPGGTLISSGIVVDRAEEVRSRLEGLGLATIDEMRDGDWVAFISRKADQ